MGLSNKLTDISGCGSDLITIVHGQFTRRVEEGTEGAVMRRLTKGKNEGKEVWEVHYPALSGVLVSIDISESKFGGCDGTIVMKDTQTHETFTIQTGADNGKFTDFIKYLPNIDTRNEFRLELHPKKNGKLDSNGHPVTDLKVIQNGRVVQNYYQEWDNQAQKYVCINGMPDWVKTPKGWNHDDQDVWLWERAQEFMETHQDPTIGVEYHPAMDADGAKETPPDEPDDDVPF